MADLTKPSNIARGSTIQDTDVGGLYDLLLGTSNYDNIKLNGVKVYAARLNRSATPPGNPVATIAYNTLSGPIEWVLTNTGVCTGTLTGAFVENKTILILSTGYLSTDAKLVLHRENSNDIIIYSYDDLGFKNFVGTAYVLILVFP